MPSPYGGFFCAEYFLDWRKHTPCQKPRSAANQSILLARERLDQWANWITVFGTVIRRLRFGAFARCPSLRWAKDLPLLHPVGRERFS